MGLTDLRRCLPWLALAAPLLLGGCATIYRPVGVVLTDYAQDEVVPLALASDDISLTTCGTGLGLHQLLASFGNVIRRPHLDLMDTELLSAYCSEANANEAHLDYMKAVYAGNAPQAKDAHVVEQRWQKVTATRRYDAYKDFVAAYGPVGVSGSDCPGFEYDVEAAQYLAGLITSVQALLSDIQAGSVVGVPQDIAVKVAKSSACLDNNKWWGVPQAIRGVVWATVPGSAPAGEDAWTTLAQADAIGKQTGMPLAATLYAIAAYGASDQAKEEQAIREFVEIQKQNQIPRKYALLAAIGTFETQQLSDQIWIRATGSRTPYEQLGTFPDDKPKQPAADVDNLLN